MTETGKLLGERFGRALQQTHQLFGGDRRKGGDIPYIAHLLWVCSLVLYDGGDEEEAVAALLHDTLEDKPNLMTREDLLEAYGSRVLSIIDVSTDTPRDYLGGVKPPWQQRKLSFLESVEKCSPDLLRVAVADKVDNARSILGDYAQFGEQLWDRFNAGKKDIQWYYRASVDVFRRASFKSTLLDMLDELVGQIEKL